MFERSGPLTVKGLPGSGADFLERLKRFVLDGSAIIASPHKIFGPQTNDLALQLRKRVVSQSCLRAWPQTSAWSLTYAISSKRASRLSSSATRRPRHVFAVGDAYVAAVTNYNFLAHAVWTTDEAVSQLRVSA